jgi:hypothetical protein
VNRSCREITTEEIAHRLAGASYWYKLVEMKVYGSCEDSRSVLHGCSDALRELRLGHRSE